MTIQQLKYIVTLAGAKSINEAARKLFISQPSLSNAVKDIEEEAGITIFTRSKSGITLTAEGIEFVGYARQVLQQLELLEDKYISNLPRKTRFGVSTQHYTFTENAFVEMVRRFGQDRYEFYFNETTTRQILEDVRNRFSDLGIIYLSEENEQVIKRDLEELDLTFTSLFNASPHVFLQKDHPLAVRKSLKLEDLAPYPRLNFVQGAYGSSFYAEEMFSSIPVDKEIHISDRGAIVNFMVGFDAYTISSGIFPRYLHGESIIAVPLDEKERMKIGYITNHGQALSELGEIYITELRKYDPELTGE